MPLRKHCLLIALYCLGIQHLFAADPPAKRQYIPYFAFYSENRPFHERYLLNPIGFTSKELGRSFALVAGVSEYPKMSEARYKKLPQAAEDIRHLVAYLRDYEYFDEIVVLKDEAVNYENLNYFLDVYFPQQLRSSPKSRFLFAYSGHGMAEGKAPTGYLLKSSAQDFKDKENMIQMSVVRELLAPIIENGHQVLALINACHSGAFLRYSSAGGTLPRLAGAHAITAGGSTEKTWGDTQVGTGSMFFENLLIGLGGAADSSKDGIVTVDELYSFLKQKISAFTDEAQNPRLGDLRLQDNDGSFFS